MRTLAEIEMDLSHSLERAGETCTAQSLIDAAEQVLENWIVAQGAVPTAEMREGFRLLALHRQGADGQPSFNACRETCREIVYHYNLLQLSADPALDARRGRMMAMLVKHLALFVEGKLRESGMGEFCCSSRPLRLESA